MKKKTTNLYTPKLFAIGLGPMLLFEWNFTHFLTRMTDKYERTLDKQENGSHNSTVKMTHYQIVLLTQIIFFPSIHTWQTGKISSADESLCDVARATTWLSISRKRKLIIV